MSIKGMKKFSHRAPTGICTRCQTRHELSCMTNGVTYEQINLCQDCRSAQYHVAWNKVGDYERSHNITAAQDLTPEQEG